MSKQRSLDIEQIVKDWAWREYDRTATRKQRRLREKEKKNASRYLNVNLDWSEVKFVDTTDWPRLAQEKAADDNENESEVSQQAAASGNTHANVLFQTKFTNNTQDGQEYTLKTEKTTRSSCSTEVETSYTRVIEMSLNLKTPGEIFEANAGYTRELTLTNNAGETIEEELTWGVESLIKVKAEHIAEAQLVVNEKKYSGEFVVITKIKGEIFVNFTNIKDNNALVKATSHDVAEIVKDHLQMQRRIGEAVDYVEVQGDTVVIRTKGRCQFRFGIKQEVVVNQIPLNGKK